MLNENISSLTVSDIAALRATEPTSSEQMVVVKGYYSGVNMGGGIFVYDSDDKTTADDFGMNIVTPKGARWKRYVNDLNDVNVVFFGGISDGQTDCRDAVLKMIDWSKIHYKGDGDICIKFPAGTFFLSKIDISATHAKNLRIAGGLVTFGYLPATTLVSDKKNDDVMMTVNASFVEITSLVIDFDTINNPNTKGFYKNILTGGQFLRVSCLRFIRLGGRGLDVIDTLDCKIDQWYATGCTGSVIYGRWSGQIEGSWDHITAIELSNFNIQNCTTSETIDLPRCSQSLIRNGWIEHTEFPGDISNGQWIIEALSMEGCTNPLKCYYTRAITSQTNIQVGQGYDFSETGDEWLSAYERGRIDIDNTGMRVVGSLNYNFITGQEKLDNRSSNEKWFYIGDIFMPAVSSQAHIRIVGTSRYVHHSATITGYSTGTPEGSADIYLQSINDKMIACWHGEGSSPIVRAYIESTQSTHGKLYVKMAAYTGFAIALVDTNSVDRFQAGVCFQFEKSFTELTADKAAVINAAEDNCFEETWTGNSSVGFGYNNNNELLLLAPKVNMNTTTAGTECLRIMVNGVAYGIELRKIS